MGNAPGKNVEVLYLIIAVCPRCSTKGHPVKHGRGRCGALMALECQKRNQCKRHDSDREDSKTLKPYYSKRRYATKGGQKFNDN